MKTIVLATGNADKATEIKAMLGGSYDVVTMKSLGLDPDIVEDGETYEANALIKVHAIADELSPKGYIVMADDSGLSVDALDGAPGLYSARYAGEDVTYLDNNKKLLDAMKDVPDDKRTATFVCAVAIIFPDGREWTGRGEVHGTISRDFRGEGGFGYDPLFIVSEVGKSYAEMSDAEKNHISHRYRAMSKAKKQLDTYSRYVAFHGEKQD
jgi:XTP/dITP diphosphohydrolase